MALKENQRIIMTDNEKTTICTILTNAEQLAKYQIWTACLVVLQGTDVGNKILLNKDEMTIGRAKDVDMCLTQGNVSRIHAVIQRLDDQQFLLSDKDSTNGTSVNAKSIKSVLLKDLDVISIGDSKLKFIASDSPEQAYYDKMYRRVHLDKVLRIYNKYYFLSKLEEEIIHCQHYGSQLSLVFLNADHFKQLNDSYGHLAGDAALIQLAEICKEHIRETDILCRYGVEEFAIIIPHTDQQQAYLLSEAIRELVAKTPVNYADAAINMTVSIGITSYDPQNTQSITKGLLIAQADKALYQAKHSGRNKVIIFTPTL
jgi:diguanylate cyclase (GGDEF)-like protein